MSNKIRFTDFLQQRQSRHRGQPRSASVRGWSKVGLVCVILGRAEEARVVPDCMLSESWGALLAGHLNNFIGGKRNGTKLEKLLMLAGKKKHSFGGVS